jgi:hypothetical protein
MSFWGFFWHSGFLDLKTPEAGQAMVIYTLGQDHYIKLFKIPFFD